jgi:drug/metabolite transporter (DMT)-like permease
MPVAVTFGLALALACALATSVSFLLKQRGAVSAPPVRVRHPLRSASELFRSRWFAVGWLVALGAWALHVGALALAPLSVVQAVLSAGLVFLAVLAERYFGFRLGRRQWTGLVITAVGLAIIGITQGAQPSEPPGYALAALISIECGVLLLATGLAVMAGRLQVLQAREGLLLGAAAGALFGISDIALKFLTHAVGGGVLELISPWTFGGAGRLRYCVLCLGPRPTDRPRRRGHRAHLGGGQPRRDRRRRPDLPRFDRDRGGGDRRTDDRVRTRHRRRGPDPRAAPGRRTTRQARRGSWHRYRLK